MSKICNLAADMVAYFRDCDGVPSFVAFAYEHGLTHARLFALVDQYPTMRRAAAECRAIGDMRLVSGALRKEYDPMTVRQLLADGYNYGLPPAPMDTTVRFDVVM